MSVELIETLWNVNQRKTTVKRRTVSELIETLWNVNLRGQTMRTHGLGINRNIVECKFDNVH